MMSLTFGLFTQVSGSGPLGPLVQYNKVLVPVNTLRRFKVQRSTSIDNSVQLLPFLFL